MNYMRLLAGGLAAGVVINVTETIVWAGLFGGPYQAMMTEVGLTEASWAMPAYVASSLVLGIVLAWLYAAIRPRYGPGMATAIRAGVALWVVAWLIPVVWNAAIGIGMRPGPKVLALAVELVGVLVAAIAAGWIYREADGAMIGSRR
jgi:hypothetical protein